jgi:hypothetical protein
MVDMSDNGEITDMRSIGHRNYFFVLWSGVECRVGAAIAQSLRDWFVGFSLSPVRLPTVFQYSPSLNSSMSLTPTSMALYALTGRWMDTDSFDLYYIFWTTGQQVPLMVQPCERSM